MLFRSLEKAPHGLRSLCLSDSGWNSHIPDPMLLAKFLDALFPEVEWKCPPLASDHWRETIQEVLNLRIMRMVCERGMCLVRFGLCLSCDYADSCPLFSVVFVFVSNHVDSSIAEHRAYV